MMTEQPFDEEIPQAWVEYFRLLAEIEAKSEPTNAKTL